MKNISKLYLLIIFMFIGICCISNTSYAAICDSIGHNYGAWSGSSAGCTYSGYQSSTCSRCGSSRTRTLSALGHSWYTYQTYSATCTSPGYIIYMCSRCQTTSRTNTDALGHSWGSYSTTTSPTCTSNGVKTRYCSRCHISGTASVSALGHSWGSYSSNDEQHWQDCGRGCGATQNYGAHSDTDDDGYCNTCGRLMYLAPTKPNITVKDTNGNVLTSTWTNKDMYVYVDGSYLTAGKGGVAYQYQMNGASYTSYTSAISYKSIQTDTTFYARAYNTGQTSKISQVASRVLPKIERENPTFSISVDSQEYEKSHTATLTFGDTGGSKLKATSYTVSYTWTNSVSTPSSYDKSMTVSVSESNQTTATITKSDGTGIYHLHVKINKKITDNATNECETITLTIPFYMDNTAPVIEQKSIEPNPVALNSKATYSMDFLVLEEHSGLVTSEFTASDIVVKVNGKVSTANKNLTYKSVSNNQYEYNLVLSNITETGPITLTINKDSIPDYATNKCVEKTFQLTRKSGSNFVGPYGDNTIPVVSLAGAVTSVTLPADKNLSGIIDERYVNKYYTVQIPFIIVDIGGQDFTDILETKDLIIKAGEIEITPSVKNIKLDNETVSIDSNTNLTKYQKEYTLTLSGLVEDGFLEVTSIGASVEDFATNTNVETKFAPYTNKTPGNLNVRVFIDNTKPQPTIKNVLTPEKVHGTTNVNIALYVKELGAGMMEQQFAMSDMAIQVNGLTLAASVNKQLTPNVSNNHLSALGKDNVTNYTYNLVLSGITDNGNLRIQIAENQIIDKANNGSEPVTLDLNTVIDNVGPRLGPLTSNADKNGEVLGELIKLKITDCSDESGIAKYEWQRSEDGVLFETVFLKESVLSYCEFEDSLNDEKTYYYRVIVSDTLGNSSTSEIVQIKYRSNLNTKPTITLKKTQVDSTLVNVEGIIKSKSKIISIKFDGSELPKSVYEENVKVNNYEITTTFTWPVTQNGIYKVEAIDENGNVVEGTINVNEFSFKLPTITATKKNVSLLLPAQIIFTSNEPVRIVDKNAHPGITYDTTDFSTKIIASVSPSVDFDLTKIFIFENKGLNKVEVSVEPPLLTRFAYLRFARVGAGDLNMTTAEMKELTINMRTSKVVLSNGQIKSYYGFKNENVNTKIATQTDINVVEKLGSATETFVMNESGQLVKLKKNEAITKSENSNYINGNISGMYQKTSGLLDNYSETLLNDSTIKYQHFRATIIP